MFHHQAWLSNLESTHGVQLQPWSSKVKEEKLILQNNNNSLTTLQTSNVCFSLALDELFKKMCKLGYFTHPSEFCCLLVFNQM